MGVESKGGRMEREGEHEYLVGSSASVFRIHNVWMLGIPVIGIGWQPCLYQKTEM